MTIEIPDITKEQAEILKFLAEADSARELAKFHAAEARKMTAEAIKEEFYADNARMSNATNKRSEQVTLAANHYHHEFEFVAGVHEDSVAACIAQMAVWHRADEHCPMNIIVNSPGGSLIDGMHLFDQIAAYSKRVWDTREDIPKGTHDTTVTVRGYAASMGGILLQAADNRVIGPESYLMIHEASTMCRGKVGELQDEVDFMTKVSDQITDIFVRRTGGKTSKAKFNALWKRKDVWLTAPEALKYGFVDRIG